MRARFSARSASLRFSARSASLRFASLRFVRIGLLGALGVASLFVGCSLGLDESKIAAPAADGGPPPGNDTSPPPDVGVSDTRAPDAIAVDAGTGCNVDGDCVAPDGCLTPRCDTARHACVFTLCKQTAACTRAACDTAAHTCGTAAPVTFHPVSFKITAGAIGCGGVVARCIAASSTFLFVGTTNGVVAYSVADPGNPSPPAIPVAGLPFAPNQIVASAGRVYFVGGLIGGRVQVAWIDTPANPLAASLTARAVLVSSTLTGVSETFAGPNLGVYLEQSDAPKLYPTGLLTAPVADLSTLDVFPNTGAPGGATAVATSGDRLVLYRWAQQGSLVGQLFSIVTATATAKAKAGVETNLNGDVGEVWGTPAVVRFGQGANGGLLWGAPLVQIGVAPVGTKAARVTWVLADGATATPSGTAHVDVEAYDPSNVSVGQAVMGPLAWVDATTGLVLAQAPQDLAQTSVQVVTNGAGGASLVAGRRVVVPISTDKLGAVSAGGYGFVVAADAPDGATVYVFAPTCT